MKILCVLYDDPKNGMPESYPLGDLPKLEKYPDGMTLPSPKGRDFNPGTFRMCVRRVRIKKIFRKCWA